MADQAASDRSIHLVSSNDYHFAWMLGEQPAREVLDLDLPAGGVEKANILAMLRIGAAAVRQVLGVGSWMIIHQNVVAGLCSYKAVPDVNGSVEIGYGIAAEYRGRGLATIAIRKLIQISVDDTRISELTARTDAVNLPSQRALLKNGFALRGNNDRAADQELVWTLSLAPLR